MHDINIDEEKNSAEVTLGSKEGLDVILEQKFIQIRGKKGLIWIPDVHSRTPVSVQVLEAISKPAYCCILRQLPETIDQETIVKIFDTVLNVSITVNDISLDKATRSATVSLPSQEDLDVALSSSPVPVRGSKGSKNRSSTHFSVIVERVEAEPCVAIYPIPRDITSEDIIMAFNLLLGINVSKVHLDPEQSMAKLTFESKQHEKEALDKKEFLLKGVKVPL